MTWHVTSIVSVLLWESDSRLGMLISRQLAEPPPYMKTVVGLQFRFLFFSCAHILHLILWFWSSSSLPPSQYPLLSSFLPLVGAGRYFMIYPLYSTLTHNRTKIDRPTFKMVNYRTMAVASFLASVNGLPLNINLGAYSPAL